MQTAQMGTADMQSGVKSALPDVLVVAVLLLALWRMAATPTPLWAGRIWRRIRHKNHLPG